MPEDNRQPIRVLIVDDEPIHLRMLARFLEDPAFIVTPADGPFTALEAFRNGTFDVVVTDESMPGMNGQALIGEIREQSPNMPCILLTGLAAFVTTSRVTADAVMGKPVDAGELRETIQRLAGSVSR